MFPNRTGLPTTIPGAFAQVIVRGESGAVLAAAGTALACARAGTVRSRARQPGNAVDAARDLARELGGCAMAAVKEDQDLGHRGLPSIGMRQQTVAP